MCILATSLAPTGWPKIIFGILLFIIFSIIAYSVIVSIQYKDDFIVTEDKHGIKFFVVNHLVDDQYIVRDVDGQSPIKVMGIDEVINGFLGYKSKN